MANPKYSQSQTAPLERCPFSGAENGPTNLLSEEALQNPYPVYEQLRRDCPVAYLEDQNIWVITRYDDCEYVLTHPEKFSSREAVSSVNAYRDSSEALAILAESKARPRARTLIMSDPPDHDRYRTILQRCLSPAKTIRQLTPRMKEVIDRLIDSFCERGECEFVREFAYPLPMLVVAAILDVPDEKIDMLKAWSDDFISVQAGNIPADKVVSAARHTIEFEEWILQRLEDRRTTPKDDFLGRLVDRPEDEAELSTPELVNICLQVLVGGNETTTNFLGNALHRLISTPSLIEDLKNEPQRTGDLIEEILRAESPLQGLFRVAVDEHDFNGTIIPKGAKLMLCFGSANRDEKYYGNGRFDPDRDNRETMHMAFGRGIHSCAGQGFARREGVLALTRILERLPNLSFDPIQQPERHTLFTIWGMKKLHITFDPTPKVGTKSTDI